MDLCWQSMFLLFNTLSRFVITFLLDWGTKSQATDYYMILRESFMNSNLQFLELWKVGDRLNKRLSALSVERFSFCSHLKCHCRDVGREQVGEAPVTPSLFPCSAALASERASSDSGTTFPKGSFHYEYPSQNGPILSWKWSQTSGLYCCNPICVPEFLIF